jgi:heat shock protein HtpX
MLNLFKTGLLMTGLMGLCMGIGYLVGGQNAMLFALVLGGAMNILAYYFSDRIALATMRAQQVRRNDDPDLYDLVDELSKKAGIPMPRVYISPAAAPNAFATGRNPSHSAVCVTAGLRSLLNREELAGVVAHELGHVRNRDILIGTIAAVIAGAISYLSYMALWFGGRGSDRHPIVGLLLVIFAPLAAMMIQMAISRSREYAADDTGAELAGSPRGLAQALLKLHSAGKRVPLPVPDSQSHLFIVAPLTGREFASLFATHPPVEKRVERLLGTK